MYKGLYIRVHKYMHRGLYILEIFLLTISPLFSKLKLKMFIDTSVVRHTKLNGFSIITDFGGFSGCYPFDREL